MSGFLASMINPELVFTDLPCTDRQTFLQYISRRLEEKDYVKCSFEGAIIEREKKYPVCRRSISMLRCHIPTYSMQKIQLLYQ